MIIKATVGIFQQNSIGILTSMLNIFFFSGMKILFVNQDKIQVHDRVGIKYSNRAKTVYDQIKVCAIIDKLYKKIQLLSSKMLVFNVQFNQQHKLILYGINSIQNGFMRG